MEYPLSYREVIPEQQQSWKEINLNIGGTQSTLQDIKVSERANGYCYRDSSKFHTRNRFIYWRIHHNVLDLVEHSFDVNLAGNKIRYKFSDAPILGGISIQETFTNVEVLVPTVCSVHILRFPHPDRLHVPGDILDVHPDLSVPSIFADVSQANNKSIFYVYTNPDSQVPYIATSTATPYDTLFLFAYVSGELRLVSNIVPDESTTGPNFSVNAFVGETLELRREAKVPRFLSGLANKITKLGVGTGTATSSTGGRGGTSANPDSIVSILLHTIGVQTYAMALCHDARILVWSCDKGQCVGDSDVIADSATDKQTIPGAHNHVFQRATHGDYVEYFENSPTNGILIAFLSFATSSLFHILRPVVSGSQFYLERICNIESPKADLVDFSFTPTRLWALYRDDIDSQTASVWSICLNNAENNTQNTWQPIILEPMLPSDEIVINPELDAKQNYVDYIFYPGRFPLNIISKALSIYKRSAVLSDMTLSVQNLRQRVCMAVEAEIVHELKEEEVDDDDYQENAYWCWSRFYSCCVQYYITGLRPLGLLLLPSVSGAVLIKKDSYSILRPLDMIEHLALCNDHSYPHQFQHCIDMSNVQDEMPDLIKLIALLMQLDEHLCEDNKRKFDKECFTHSPDNVAIRMLPELKESDFNDLNDLEMALKNKLLSALSPYANLQKTIHILLTLLSLNAPISQESADDESPSNDNELNSSLYPDLQETLQEEQDIVMDIRESESTPSAFPAKLTHEEDESDSSGSGGRKYLISSARDGMDFQSDFRAKDDEREQRMEPLYGEMVRMESVRHLFSSPLGVNIISKIVGQQTELRYCLCRALLILHALILEEDRVPNCVEGDATYVTDAFRAICLADVVRLVRCYHAQNWLVNGVCATTVLPTGGMMQRLASLKLTPVYGIKTSNLQSYLLFELFTYSTGGQDAHKQLARLINDDDTLAHWHLSMLPYANKLMQLIWPMNGNTSLPEWLLVCGQHLRLHQYVSLLNNWCEPSDLSRSFILALSFLATGEKQKAYDYFFKSSKGVCSEKYIMDRVPRSTVDGSEPFILYFLRVINLFEQYGYVDCAMDCANSILTAQDMDITLRATLYSILFKHRLALGDYEEAYQVLIHNPDVERQKDNLRDFVKTLLDKKQLHTLINFEYTGNEDLFCSILHTRAQATDCVNNMYYDFLYAFHMKRGMHFIRQAATVMYEQGYRLRQYNSSNALEKQVKCYLAAVNALSLMEPEFAYVIKPAEQDKNELHKNMENSFLDQELNSLQEEQQDSESIELNLNVKENVEALYIDDIKKELDFGKARLRLAKYDADSVADHRTSPEELVILLVNAGLFKTALLLCKRFVIPNDLVFEHLTRCCVQLSRIEDANAWNWLAENDLQELSYIGNTPSDVAWNLLKTFMEYYENPSASIIHKVIVQKLLEMGYFLPHWILASYKKRNASELLRLFYFNGYLQEAVKLAKEYLFAALGHGPEHFGLSTGIIAAEEPFCLPLFTIENLIDEIDSQNKVDLDRPFENDHVELLSIFQKYIFTITQLTNEKCIHELSKLKS